MILLRAASNTLDDSVMGEAALLSLLLNMEASMAESMADGSVTFRFASQAQYVSKMCCALFFLME